MMLQVFFHFEYSKFLAPLLPHSHTIPFPFFFFQASLNILILGGVF